MHSIFKCIFLMFCSKTFSSPFFSDIVFSFESNSNPFPNPMIETYLSLIENQTLAISWSQKYETSNLLFLVPKGILYSLNFSFPAIVFSKQAAYPQNTSVPPFSQRIFKLKSEYCTFWIEKRSQNPIPSNFSLCADRFVSSSPEGLKSQKCNNYLTDDVGAYRGFGNLNEYVTAYSLFDMTKIVINGKERLMIAYRVYNNGIGTIKGGFFEENCTDFYDSDIVVRGAFSDVTSISLHPLLNGKGVLMVYLAEFKIGNYNILFETFDQNWAATGPLRGFEFDLQEPIPYLKISCLQKSNGEFLVLWNLNGVFMREAGPAKVGQNIKLNSTSPMFMTPALLDDNTLIVFYYDDISYHTQITQQTPYIIYNLSDNSSAPISGAINQSFVGILQNIKKINENDSVLLFSNHTSFLGIYMSQNRIFPNANSSSTNGSFTNGSSTNGSSTNSSTSTNGTSTNGTSTNGTSTNGTSTNGTSTNSSASANGTSANRTSTNDTSTNGTSTNVTSTNGTSINNTSTNSTTGNNTNNSTKTDSSSESLKLILEISIPISVGVLIFIFFGFYWCWRKHKKRQRLSDNSTLEEETIIKQTPLLLNSNIFNESENTQLSSTVTNISRFKQYVSDVQSNDDAICYEILNDDEEFQNFFQIKKARKLGEGGFGQVWEAYDKKRQSFALKLFVVEKNFTNERDYDLFINMIEEHQTLNKLSSPYIVYVYGIAYSFTKDETLLGIVEELLDEDLNNFLKVNRNLTFPLKLDIAIKICNAFLLIHNKKFIHHDIKPANLLIRRKNDNEVEIKVSDFGTCLKTGINGNNSLLKGISLRYASPENILHFYCGEEFQNNPKSDIWSIGLIFIEIFLQGKKNKITFPWSNLFNEMGDDRNEKIREIIRAEEEKVRCEYIRKESSGDLCMDQILNIIDRCLQLKIDLRPNIDEILEFLINIENSFNI